ncbi:MAG: AAA family ATPase [Oscillatoriaceae cyanobacterium]
MLEHRLLFITAQNYKNLEFRQPVDLNNLNLLIGANNFGKSNLISCLSFLKNSLINRPDESRGIGSLEDAAAKIGGGRILDFHVESPALVNLAYCFGIPGDTRGAILDFDLYADRQRNRVNVAKEYLYSGEVLQQERDTSRFYYYQFHDRETGKGAVSVYNEGDSGQTHFEPLDNIPTNTLGLASIPSLLETSKYAPEKTPIYKIRREILESVSTWQFYNANHMDLNAIREATPKIGGSDIYLSASGDNLALVLDNLSQQDIDFEDSINEAMKLIIPKTRRLRPIRSGVMSLTVEWYIEGLKEPFYLPEMSDGTVRMLCWATILRSPRLPALLVIDEPEMGLHVAWMPILAEWIKQAARKTQVIITTHSPDLLDHFTDSLENVLCFVPENQTHFSIKRLSPEMLEPKLNEGWELGDLYRVGDPSIGGWPW